MAEETGGKSGDNDVYPVLSFVSSKIEDVDAEKKTFSLPDLKGDSEEDFSLEEHLFGVSDFVADGDKVENLEDEEGSIDEDETVIAQPEPQAASTPRRADTNKKLKIQVDPNASMKDVDENSHYLTALPVLPESDASYTPVLYTFRVRTKGKTTKLKKITSKPPPFYLQFDHAIAVIWTLFNKEANKNSLGIVQLQWGLHFLESIYNSEGIHPKDVQLCIDTIQDYLIDQYAEMSQEAVIYGSSKLEDFISEEETQKKTPFSVNYSQMIKKCPPCSAVDTDDSGVLLDKQLLDELENVKNVVGIESIDLTHVVSKEQVMNILSEWKKEQIEKIQDELKMLYVVEDMMKNSDSQNFDGYTDESQFQSIFRKN